MISCSALLARVTVTSLAATFVVACTTLAPNATPTAAPTSSSESPPSAEATQAPPPPSSSAEVVASPGQPYTTAAIMPLLRAAPYPGLPAVLISPRVAEQLAAAIWTYDGHPYRLAGVKGACAPTDCDLSLQGVPSFCPLSNLERACEDAYDFTVHLPDLALRPVLTGGWQELKGYPDSLDPILEELARSLIPADDLAGLLYVPGGAIWSPPPSFGRFRLHFSDGNEEGGRNADVVIDLPQGKLIEFRPYVCC